MAKNGKLVFKNGKIGRFSPSEKNAVLKKHQRCRVQLVAPFSWWNIGLVQWRTLRNCLKNTMPS